MSEQKPREQHLYEWYMAFMDRYVSAMINEQQTKLRNLPFDTVLLHIYAIFSLSICLQSCKGFVSIKYSDKHINKFVYSGIYDFVKLYVNRSNFSYNKYIIKYIIDFVQKEIPIENIIAMNKYQKTKELMKLPGSYSFTAGAYECLICGDKGLSHYNTPIAHMKKIHGIKFRNGSYYKHIYDVRDPLEEIPKKYINEMRCVVCNANFVIFCEKTQNMNMEPVFDHILRAHVKTPENKLIVNRITELLAGVQIT